MSPVISTLYKVCTVIHYFIKYVQNVLYAHGGKYIYTALYLSALLIHLSISILCNTILLPHYIYFHSCSY